MKWFANATTRSKLLLGFGVFLALIGVVIVVGYEGLASLYQSQRRIAEEGFRASLAMQSISGLQDRQRAEMLELLQTGDEALQAGRAREIAERSQEIDRLMGEIIAAMKGRGDAEDTANLAEVRQVLATYREVRTRELELVRLGKVEAARALGSGEQADRIQRVREKLQEVTTHLEKEAVAAVAQAQERVRDTLRVFALVGALALGFGVFMVWLMNRLIAAPLKAVTSIAERVAAGDLTVQLDAGERADEVGALQRAFRTLVEKLRRISAAAERVAAGDLTVQLDAAGERPNEADTLQRALRTMFENLRETHRELRKGINVLASSSTEILSTISQVATSANETSAAVGETSTTAEEVKQTAHLSTQKAGAVKETAQRAAAVSENGRKAVAETIEVMNRIQEQMESIAQSVVRLSEQGQAIGEIIATVNDLAEQSNVLAVNAAIEATRAGEFGKGFAVVAQEVKSLAEQSRQATAQVRTILMEVQKATSAAVLATEQGTKAVSAGVKQAASASDAIGTLTESVGEAAQAGAQIAASSQQQLVGMDQIASAIANIRQAMNENVAGTRQLETSAQSLQELGGRLKTMVERQRIEG